MGESHARALRSELPRTVNGTGHTDPSEVNGTGQSLLAAELQQLLHLSFCPYFFGDSPPRAGAYMAAKYGGTRAV